MKKFTSPLVFIFSAFAIVINLGLIPVKSKVIQVNKNVVVLELFTSQGCSSCPAADRLLGNYSKRNDIIALSFHVDYWNRLGWKDPFSNHLFSERQQKYASIFGKGSVYTPQLIVNGDKEMVGSDEDKISNVIKEFQKKCSSSQISIDEIKMENNKIIVMTSLKGLLKNSSLNIALVQNKITTNIKAGENEGLQITNYNVVRRFKTINSPAAEKVTTIIDAFEGFNNKESSIIAFLQDVETNKIYTAVKSSF